MALLEGKSMHPIDDLKAVDFKHNLGNICLSKIPFTCVDSEGVACKGIREKLENG